MTTQLLSCEFRCLSCTSEDQDVGKTSKNRQLCNNKLYKQGCANSTIRVMKTENKMFQTSEANSLCCGTTQSVAADMLLMFPQQG